MRSEAQEAAYVEFVTARQNHLRRVAYAVCGDWQRADALLDHALTRLYVVWPRQQRDGTEEVFVRRTILRIVDDSPAAPRPGSGPSALFSTLQSLPLAQRKAAVLRHWLGLSAQEAADELGTTIRSVESQTARARVALEEAAATDASAQDSSAHEASAHDASAQEDP